MDEKELKNITVIIAGRPYPLKVDEESEDSIRQIAKDINDKINDFQLNYNKKDKQDCLAMALLTYAVDLHKLQTSQPNTPPESGEQMDFTGVTSQIEQLDQLLDSFLK